MGEIFVHDISMCIVIQMHHTMMYNCSIKLLYIQCNNSYLIIPSEGHTSLIIEHCILHKRTVYNHMKKFPDTFQTLPV